MDQKFETNRTPIQEMDIGKKKILDESLPLPQMNKQQTLSACKLLVHYAHHRARRQITWLRRRLKRCLIFEWNVMFEISKVNQFVLQSWSEASRITFNCFSP